MAPTIARACTREGLRRERRAPWRHARCERRTRRPRIGPPEERMPSVTAISSGVRPARRSPCMTSPRTPAHTATQLSLQSARPKSALECRFTGSSPNTYVCSCASVRSATYLYEHMFPLRTPSPLTRRARNVLSLARSFLLLEDDYVRDWEVADELGQDRSKIDGISDRPARERAAVRHPHRTTLRGRSARARAGEPVRTPQVCLCPVEHPSPATMRRTSSQARTGRPQAARK